jgi:hypothetical protein
MNGIKQNSVAETNVVVSGIKNGGYSLKLIFEDGKTKDIDKNMFLDAAQDVTAKVVFKKGAGKLQMVSMLPATGTVAAGSITYRPDNTAAYSDATTTTTTTTQTVTTESSTISSGHANGNQGNGNGSVGIQIVTPTPAPNETPTNNGNGGVNIQFNDPNTNQNVNMNININGTAVDTNRQNVNINVNGDMPNSGNTRPNSNSTNVNVNTGSTTTTTTTTTTTVNSATNSNQNNTNANATHAGGTSNGRMVCPNSLTNAETLKTELKGYNFEDDRVDALKISLKNKCVYAADAVKLLDLFTFDANQLEVAKFLSDHLIDYDNASSLAAKFSFDSSKMEYMNYIGRE